MTQHEQAHVRIPAPLNFMDRSGCVAQTPSEYLSEGAQPKKKAEAGGTMIVAAPIGDNGGAPDAPPAAKAVKPGKVAGAAVDGDDGS